MTLTHAFDAFILDQRLRGNTEKTIRGYEGFISLFVTWLASHAIERVAALELQHVQKYQIYIGNRNCENKNQKLTKRTVRTYMKHIRIFLTFCYAESYISEPIHLKMKIPRAERPIIEILTDTEADALLDACEADVLGRRNRAIISLMLDCGLRLSEVSGIRESDINFENGYVKVMGKGRKGRIVPIGNSVREALEEYIRIRPETKYKNIFLSIRETPLTRDGIIQMMKRMKNEIPRLHAHLLRHTFATNFLVHGLGDVYELSRILGHSDIKTTEGYLQLASYYKILRNRTRQTYLDNKKSPSAQR